MKLGIIVTTAVLCVVSLLAPAYAEGKDGLVLDVNLASYHFKKAQGKKYNEFNPGIGVTAPISSFLEVKGGVYKNTQSRTSVYAGLNVKHSFLFSNWEVTPGVAAFIMTGYGELSMVKKMDLPYGAAPAVALNVRLMYKDTGVSIGYSPMSVLSKKVSDLVTLQICYRF